MHVLVKFNWSSNTPGTLIMQLKSKQSAPAMQVGCTKGAEQRVAPFGVAFRRSPETNLINSCLGVCVFIFQFGYFQPSAGQVGTMPRNERSK